ncbi:capZ-interacting protein isoform X5 [Salmo salar]|uniref:CapZ-interacting protein isoform X5 n=1 Tax=Salmo salar TaxID=8030 RepID=A0ABM3DMR0_SALSA|nr:capZ-interacting protein isoform X5 [Salmo salar]XP_045560096.1 capZ-interacting protein isoform X5 [Salmo salar]
MEKDSPVKPSVAELAGRFKDHVIPTPTPHDESKPVKRRPPPCSLQLHNKKHDHEELEKPSIVSPHPPKVKMRTSKSSPLVERLQANLTLSPTSLLPSPKSPEVKLAPTPTSPTTHCFFPTSPCSPLSPTLRPQLSIEEEEPVCFESPAEGTPLPSFNKMTSGNRPRLTTNDAAEEGNPLLSPEQVPVDNGVQHRVDGEEMTSGNRPRLTTNDAAEEGNPLLSPEQVPVDNGVQHRVDGEEVSQESISLIVQNSIANKEMTCITHRRRWMILIFLIFLILLVIGVSFALCLVIHDDADEKYNPTLFVLPRCFNGSFKLTNQIFIPELLSPASNQSKALSSQLREKLSDLYSSSPALSRYFSSVEISDFRNGSVVADYRLGFLMPLNNAELEQFTLSREMVYNVFRQSLYDQDPELNHPLYIHPASLDMQVTGESRSDVLYW